MIELGLSPEEAMASQIKAVFGVTPYPVRLPSAPVLPAMVYQVISTPSQMTHTGPSGYAIVRIQYGIIAKTYEEVKAWGQKFRASFDGMKGTWAGLNVQSVMIENEFDSPEPPDSTLHRRLFQLAIEYSAV
jgi:hypothetical protein